MPNCETCEGEIVFDGGCPTCKSPESVLKVPHRFRKTKVCYICKKNKKLSSFFRDKNRKDGHQSRCKDCNGVKRFSFECPNCKTKHGGATAKPMACPKCWRVSKPVKMNY